LKTLKGYRPLTGLCEIPTNHKLTTQGLTKQRSTNELQTWNLIFSAWRNATAVVVLRNLYFGLPDAEIISTISRSPTPTPNAQGTARTFSPNLFEESSHRLGDTSIEQYAEESADDYFNLEHLAPEAYTGDPYSRTPSPMPAQRPPDQSITFDHWNRRYEIHNDAVFELFNIYSALLKLEDATYLRYAMLPLLVFSLVSRPGSIERALAIETFEFFKHSMASQRAPSNPIGGAMLELDIAWDRLDAYSAEIERQQRESTVWIETGLLNSAPEWNWRYMLEQMNLMSACKWWANQRCQDLAIESERILTCCSRAHYLWCNELGAWNGILGFQRSSNGLHREHVRGIYAASVIFTRGFFFNMIHLGTLND
jgi:hypothetical protein